MARLHTTRPDQLSEENCKVSLYCSYTDIVPMSIVLADDYGQSLVVIPYKSEFFNTNTTAVFYVSLFSLKFRANVRQEKRVYVFADYLSACCDVLFSS